MENFRWATGIEGSFIPHLGIDQFEWTQHDRFWEDDFRRVADLGLTWLRYPIPWHILESSRGSWDWSWTDKRFAFAQKLGLNLMIDLVHFGVPAWLPQAFADPALPEALEKFASQFASQYRHTARSICPINEPLITTLFCGDIGLWPPYGKGLSNYMTVLSRVAQGYVRATQALRSIIPDVEIFSCDALEVAVTYEDSDETTSPFLREPLKRDVARRMERRHIVTDLSMGLIDSRHPLHDWMIEHGFSRFDLEWFRQNAVKIDVIGLDYYSHTEVELYTSPEGYYRQRIPLVPIGLYRAAKDYWERYRLPLMITETSACGNDHAKIEWLEQMTADIRKLREEGIPVIGFTWWPLVDHLDWDGAMLHQIGHIHPVGIFQLEPDAHGALQRHRTGLADRFREMAAGGEKEIGHWVPPLSETEMVSVEKRFGVASRKQIDRAPLIAFSTTRWDGIWRRPQQIISRLSAQRRVLFIEPPHFKLQQEEPRWASIFDPHFPNLIALRPLFPCTWKIEPERVKESLPSLYSQARRHPVWSLKMENPVLWFDNEEWFAAAHDFENGNRKIIYDCPVNQESGLLLKHAAWTWSRSRLQSAVLHSIETDFLPNGVDATHFGSTQKEETPVPPDIDFIPSPVIGFSGAIDDRLDFGQILAVAEARPQWNFVFIGPVPFSTHVPRRENIFWMGKRPYLRLPEYFKKWQAAWIPFKTEPSNQFLFHSSILEALAAARPVVATQSPEINSWAYAGIETASNTGEWLDRLEKSIHADPASIRLSGKILKEHSWETLLETIEERWSQIFPA